VEIVGGFVKLKKRGASYLGLCPFHNEKTPSFTVSPVKEIYKCFGCGKSGNTVSFLMEHEKYSYVEALKWLAAKYNVEVEETEVSAEQKMQQQVADSLHIINNFAQKFFTDKLWNSQEGEDVALSYLKQRGFRKDVIEKFQLGYSPQQRDTFATAAINAQYNLDLLQKSGLVVVRDDRPADNYRGRIIFPVHNQTGKVIGFGARLIAKNDKAPKYINTPENELYVKSKILYGSYFARQAIDKNDECLLVEGYTDVISLHQAGIENVVASGGTSLTQDQLRLIKKYTSNLTIIYDGDNAGVKAALRGLDMALEEGLNVRLVLIPDKEDPDSYVNKVGVTAFKDFVAANKKDFILFQLEIALKDVGSDSAKKAEVVNQIAETISRMNKLEDFTKKQDYIKKSAALLQVEEAGLLNLVNKFTREKVAKIESRSSVADVIIENPEIIPSEQSFHDDTFTMLHRDRLQEEAVVRSLLEHGLKPFEDTRTVAEEIFQQEIDDDLFQDDLLKTIMHKYKGMYEAGERPEVKDFAYLPEQDIATRTIAITQFPYQLSKRWSEAEHGNVDRRIFDLSTNEFLNRIVESDDPDERHSFDVIDDTYKNEVNKTLIYVKIRKVNRLILQNQLDLQNPNHPFEEIRELMQVHIKLKEIQQDLGKKIGNVIFPV
jgi:DNA primase